MPLGRQLISWLLLLGLLLRLFQMVLEGGIVRHLLQSLLEQVNGGWVKTLLVIGPAQSVGGIGTVGHQAARGLREGDGDIDISASLQHDVGKIVGGDGIVGLNLESFLVHALGPIPVLLAFIQFAEQDVERDFSGVVLDGLLESCDGLIDGALGAENLAKFQESVRVLLVEFGGFAQGRFCGLVVLLVVEERRTQQVVEGTAVGAGRCS